MATGTEPQKTAQIILDTVPRTMHWIRQEMRALARSELSVPQFRVLALLHRGELDTVSELATWIGVTMPAMSRMVELLVKRDLVIRCGDTRDRRQIRLVLSPKGLEFYGKLRRRVERSLSESLEGLSPEARGEIAKGVAALAQMVRA